MAASPRKPVAPRKRRVKQAKTRQRLTGDERKTNFLDAAQAMIRQRGLEALTMEGLAAHCNVNKALPYRHFANRDDVLVALFDKETSEFDVRLAKAMTKASGFEASLGVLVRTWCGDLESGIGTPELMHARTTDGQLEARRRVRTLVAADYIADLIQTSYDLRRADAKLAAAVLLAGSQGLAAIWRATDANQGRLIESFVKMSVGAVAAIAKE